MKKPKRNHRLQLFLVFVVLWSREFVQGSTRKLGFEGQLSGWVTLNTDRSDAALKGLRYIPDFSIHVPISKQWTAATELSVNAYCSGRSTSWNPFFDDGRIRPYRFWVRLATTQFEARIGLQKISFGSAMLIRPLMWFDRLDARDPLQLTDGVYGLLFRYTFLNNANAWIWGLYGNDETKGWETFPSDGRESEYGGRLQIPTPKGEMAVSAHHRRMDLKKGQVGILPRGPGSALEDRFGIDGKWDVGIGVWIESAWIHQQLRFPFMPYQRFLSIGMDDTFGVGNGVHVLSEFFRSVVSDRFLGPGEGISFSALSINYPFGLLDNLTAMLYYDWNNRTWYRFVNWQRKYDNWSCYFIAFWNPERIQIYPNLQGKNPFAGKGVQWMVVWNH